MSAKAKMRQSATVGPILLFAFACVVLASCRPVVAVVHQDHTREAVDVWVDREYVGQVGLGEELSEKVERGHHLIEARPRGDRTSPWTRDGKGWRVFVDRGTILTLLPVAAPEKQADEGRETDKKKVHLPIVAPQGEEELGAEVGYEERKGAVGDNPY